MQISYLTQQIQAGAGGAAVKQVLDQFEGDFGGPQKTRKVCPNHTECSDQQ